MFKFELRTIDKIGLFSFIIAGFFFVSEIETMSVKETEWKYNWKKFEIYGVLDSVQKHNERGEKQFFIYSVRTKNSLVKIIDYGVDDSSFFVYLKKGDSVSKHPNSNGFELYKSDTLFEKFYPIKN